MSGPEHKSEYELLRERNIERNKLIMKQLGLDDFDFNLHKAHTQTAKKSASAPKRKRESARMGDRRSSRLAGEPASSSSRNFDGDLQEGGGCASRLKTEAALRGSEEDHALAAAEHLRWAGKQGKVTIVGTASYKHTLMRVRTMSEPALERRIKAIERAAGKVRNFSIAISILTLLSCDVLFDVFTVSTPWLRCGCLHGSCASKVTTTLPQMPLRRWIASLPFSGTPGRRKWRRKRGGSPQVRRAQSKLERRHPEIWKKVGAWCKGSYSYSQFQKS